MRLNGMKISAAETVCPAFGETRASPDVSVTIFSPPQLKRSTFLGSPAWSGEFPATIANMHIPLKTIAGRLL